MQYGNIFGMYNDSVTFKDGESTGIEVQRMSTLKHDMRRNPRRYTHDLVDMVNLPERSGLEMIRK